MAEIKFTIPNNKIPELVEAFSAEFLYSSGKLQGETQGAFTERMIREWVVGVHREYKKKQRVEEALNRPTVDIPIS